MTYLLLLTAAFLLIASWIALIKRRRRLIKLRPEWDRSELETPALKVCPKSLLRQDASDAKSGVCSLEDFFYMARYGTIPLEFDGWDLDLKKSAEDLDSAAECGHIPGDFSLR